MANYDYDSFDSQYLCRYCGGLLYRDTATPPNDVCINENCQLWPRDFSSLMDATEAEEPRIYRELQDQEKLLIDAIHRWKPGRLARYAYEGRRELITVFFRKGIMPLIDDFIALGELLLMTNRYPSEGTIDDIGRFRLLLKDTQKWSQSQRNLEDLRSKRVVFGKTGSGLKLLFIKYTMAYAQFQREIGLISNKEVPPSESLFPYADLEGAVTPELDFARLTDAKEILEPFWILSLQSRYWLQQHHRTKSQYDYRPDILDFSVLFGWLMQTWHRDELFLITTEKQEKEMAEIQGHFDAQCKGRYSAQRFLSMYVDSTELVPIVARTREGILMDHHTLLFFLIYLQGCPDPEEPAIRKREQVIQDMRVRVGEKFESWLRQELRSRGYAGPKTAVVETYEYDIIAISEGKKTIIIADAKYRDMAPSSFTGTNLLTQELLGPHALRYEAERQQERLDYFRQHMEKFARYLEPKQSWGEYEINSFLITKQIPLAHRYKEIRILPAAEFLESAT